MIEYNDIMTSSFNAPLLPSQPLSPPPARALDYPLRELHKGDALYRVGDPADTVYRVEEGLLKLNIDLATGKERIIGVAGPGDFIGALTPLHPAFEEGAEALSPRVRVRVMPRDEVQEELKDDLLAAAGLQLSRLRDALEDTELPVNARLARTFVRLGERFGHVSDAHVRLTLPLTHDNFAAMVGAARETTTAVLSEMRDEGLLSGTRGRYSFDRNELSDFALSAAF